MLQGEERDAADLVLTQAKVRSQTLLALSQMMGIDLPAEDRVIVRGLVQHIVTDQTFSLDSTLLESTEANPDQAQALLDNLQGLASSLNLGDVAEFVARPLGIRRSETEWRVDELPRAGIARHREHVLVIHHKVDDLTPARAREAVERLAVAAYLAGLPWEYFRVRFEQNGRDVAFWDAAAQQGLTWIGGDDQDLEEFEPDWPMWLIRLEELSARSARALESA